MVKRATAPPPAAIRQPNGRRKRKPHITPEAPPPAPVDSRELVNAGALATAQAAANGGAVEIVSWGQVVAWSNRGGKR